MRIDFLHPKFHKGLNSTVRRGIRDISIDERVELYETGKDIPTTTGDVIGTIITDLYMISLFPELIKYQHDEETQSFNGLMEAMGRAYGPMSMEERVTIIYFNVEE